MKMAVKKVVPKKKATSVKTRKGAVKKYRLGGQKGPGDGDTIRPLHKGPDPYGLSGPIFKRPDIYRKPTTDSTDYFTSKSVYYDEVRKANEEERNRSRKKSDRKRYKTEAKKAKIASDKAYEDFYRQGKKGRRGYDENGRPIKVDESDMRKGGKLHLGFKETQAKTVKRKDVKPLLKNMKKEVTSMRKGGKK